MSQRIFDHLYGTPEDRYFSAVARAMHGSRWWRMVPTYEEPAAVSGEVIVAARRVSA